MTRTIYVVDDDRAVRASLHGVLRNDPQTVIRGFPSGDAFLEELPELAPGLVLLDMQMPGASGLDVLHAIAGSGHFEAIVLTGHGNIAVAVEAMKAGAIDFLEKPYDPKVLIACIANADSQLQQGFAAADRAAAARAKLERLSRRETDVLMGLVAGHPNKVIAHTLAISPRTVEIYRANLMDKLGADNLSEALRIALAAGLIAA